MYVPATPATWGGGPVPAQPVPFSAPNAGPAPISTNTISGPVMVFEGAPGAPAVPATPTSMHRSLGVDAPYLAGGGVVHGGCEGPDCENANWLPKCRWNIQALSGVYSDIGDAHYNYAVTTLRRGHVCGCGCLSCLPGAFESLIELNGAHTTQSDFGQYFIGGGLLMRYNFVRLGSCVVPYIQAGAGFQYNDAFHDNQSYLGSRIELTLQGQVGTRIFLTKRLSLDFEGGLQHISNLGMSNRDDGINALGGSAGLTFFFPCGH